jgi:hypothetical protein
MKEYKVLQDLPHCLIKYNDDVPCLMVKWRGSCSSAQYREVMNFLLEAMQEHQVVKVLNDDRKLNSMITKADQLWVTEEWLPAALAIGYSGIAIIQNEAFFRKVPAAQISAMARLYFQDQIKVEYFANVKPATDWLQKA